MINFLWKGDSSCFSQSRQLSGLLDRQGAWGFSVGPGSCCPPIPGKLAQHFSPCMNTALHGKRNYTVKRLTDAHLVMSLLSTERGINL